MGDIFDLPAKIEAASDAPESWIRNIEIVDLWAKGQKYNTHDINFFKMPDGSLVCSLKDKQKITIPCPDALGMVCMPDGTRCKMQEALDLAYCQLIRDHLDCRHLWDLQIVKKWGRMPATERQLALIRKRCQGYDPAGLSKGDASQIIMVTEADGVIHAKVWGILPKDRIEIKTKKENVDYRKLIAAGSCFAEGEEVIDYGFVERWILGLEEKYGVEVMQVGYDRYNAISTVQKLEANSMECVEVKQHSSVLHPPTKLLREAILKKEFAYDENRLLEINFQNARCTEDTNLNKYVNKKRSAGKVDMVVSTIIAVYLMQQAMLDNSELDWGIQVI